MSKALATLLKLLQLEKVNANQYQGNSQDLGLRQVFGGQIIGQALFAAKQTVTAERNVHSLHSYFLRPGDSKLPITYDIEVLRDGQSFSARRVSALQHNQPIFYMTASFQAIEEGFEHQDPMPAVIGPEELLAEQQLAERVKHQLPKPMSQLFLSERAIEIRPEHFYNPLKGKVSAPINNAWFRANGVLPDDLSIHQCLLGYASDFNLLPTALQPHGLGFLETGVQIATIDHSMWFHRPFNFEDWLLYHVESTSASSGRGFVRGQFYTRQGLLIASSVQEGVIRQHQTPNPIT